MNGNIWKTIAALIAAPLVVALVIAIWGGSQQLASIETGISYISKQVDGIAADTKENTARISDLESRRRFGGRL